LYNEQTAGTKPGSGSNKARTLAGRSSEANNNSMIKQQKSKADRKKEKRLQARGGHDRRETRGAEVTTVAWMLATLTALVAELVGAGAWLLWRAFPTREMFYLLAVVMLIAALAAGVVAILLLFVARRTRNIPPPRPITTASALIGILPWFVLLATVALSTVSL